MAPDVLNLHIYWAHMATSPSPPKFGPNWLKMALERGCTPDEESSQGVKAVDNGGRCLNDDEEDQPLHDSFGSQMDDASSFYEDSVYSFESLVVPYDMDGDFEDLQTALVKPLFSDEHFKLRSLAITEDGDLYSWG